MRVLILGGDGMLGHQLRRELAPRHHVGVTRRLPSGADASPDEQTFSGVDVRDMERVAEVFATFRPEAVLNAVGIVKQRAEVDDVLLALEVNAVFPHRLARLCAAQGVRLVHFSTDCVFSGNQGRYREDDRPDPVDTYGRTKLLGEQLAPHLTLRSSIIGLERGRQQGLVEWFLASRGTIEGYRRAVFSGLTTLEMGRLADRVLVKHPDLAGVFHVASAPIDKAALLSRLTRELGRDDVQVAPVDVPVCDRSLCGDAFTAATGYRAPPWDEMLGELAAEIRSRRSRA